MICADEPSAWELWVSNPSKNQGWVRYHVYDSHKQAIAAFDRVKGPPLELKIVPLHAAARMAYERGHSAGEDEVEAIKKGMMSDFKPVFDRIKELEREIERKMSAAAFVLKERDALQADNARLREALRFANSIIGHPDDYGSKLIAEALAATPEQSLARIRNQVRDADRRSNGNEALQPI